MKIEVITELKRLAQKKGGLLIPEHVVLSARHPESPLHSAFTWDDATAAQAHRLWEARQLIRSVVEYWKVNGDEQPINVFVSLTADRKGAGGYREISAILSNQSWRKQLLADALQEMRLFEQKYAALKELASVFVAMRKAAKDL